MQRELLNPRGVFHYEDNPIAQRPPSLDQKVLALIDNSKDNAAPFLEALYRLIGKTNHISGVIRFHKPGASMPASFTPDLFERCDMVINAFGD